jgi:ATP-binding cassette subfamily B protein
VTALRTAPLIWRAARADVVVLLGLELGSAVAVAAQVVFLNELFGLVLSGEPIARHGALVVEVAAVTALPALASVFRQERTPVMAERISRFFSQRVLSVASQLELADFDRPEFFDELMRANAGARSRPAQLVQGASQTLSAVVSFAGVLVALALIAPLLFAVFAVLLVPIAVLTVVNGRVSYDFSFLMTTTERKASYVSELLFDRDAAAEIRSLRIGPQLVSRYLGLSEARERELRGVVRRRTRNALLSELASWLLLLGCGGVLWALHAGGTFTLPVLGAAGAALLQVRGRAGALGFGMAQLHEALLFQADVLRFFDRPAPAQSAWVQPPEAPLRSLALEDVSFAFSGMAHDAVHALSLELRRGELVALVGGNGSGKSTAAKLLAGLYAPAEGSLLVNGNHVDRLPDWARQRIAFLPQSFARFCFTAREGIELGRPEAAPDAQRVADAARAVGLSAVLADWPAGIESHLGREFERAGIEPSLGQWQRLALARAWFRQGDFFILDEPTAALDPEAEDALVQAMLRLRAAGAGVLVVTHRTATVDVADRVIRLGADITPRLRLENAR